MRWWVFGLALLLLLPAATALYGSYAPLTQTVQPVRNCNTNLNCLQIAKTTKLQCGPGLVLNPEPRCERGGCTFCMPQLNRPRVECKFDSSCAGTKCAAGLSARCLGRICTCSAKPRPECYSDNDCTRPLYLINRYQRLVCQRGKCVTPLPLSTMIPKYNVPVSMLPRY